jgi:hypothetical protein
MIRGTREITLDILLEKVIPATGIQNDALLADFQDAVATGRDYVLIFKDYEVRVKLDEVKAYLEKNWEVEGAEPGAIEEPIDAFIPKAKAETPAEIEARAVAAKHPKTIPAFKPQKRAPVAPPEEEII